MCEEKGKTRFRQFGFVSLIKQAPMYKIDEALFDWIDVKRPIKQMLMCKEDEALLGWIDVERPTK